MAKTENRGQNDEREYLTLWTGYLLEEATREPKENFTYQDELIEDLEAGKILEEKWLRFEVETIHGGSGCGKLGATT